MINMDLDSEHNLNSGLRGFISAALVPVPTLFYLFAVSSRGMQHSLDIWQQLL
jgi:hypothetical protein